jgi:nicotinate-nucleotide adenylyltransferase
MIKDRVIAVCGGAFNPPTLAHYRLYETTKKVVHFDHFIYLPVSLNYPKASLIDDHHRLKMLHLMTEEHGDIIVEDYEIRQNTFKGTYHSLLALKEKYQASVLFVLGTDQAQTMEHWIEAKKLLETFQFIVLDRQESWPSIIEKTPFLKAYQDRFLNVEFDQKIASSDYRSHQDKALLNRKVATYIKKHRLYEDAL